MIKIKLLHNKGVKWYKNETVSVKGCFFDDKNNFYEKEKMPLFFDGINKIEDFIETVSKINGIFTVILNKENQIMLASDTSRIFPLFYSVTKNDFYLSDNPVFLKETLNFHEINNDAVPEFFSYGYILGNKTLLKNIYQTQSDEYLIFEKKTKKIQSGFFFSYATDTVNNSLYDELKKQAINVFENAFKRLIISLKSRQVVLPLSGGYDSRLIAVMLKKHNYKNVICFTFGKKGNFEVENSKNTAKILGFKWIFIEYSTELINNYLETETFKKYVHYAGKYSSMPFLQEYFAVKYLKEKNIIDDDAVFIPGHSGDVLGGSQFIKVIPENLKYPEIHNLILKKKFFYNSLTFSEKQSVKKTIQKTLSSYNSLKDILLPYSVFEDFDIKEKFAKFIFNSSSVFNYFGYEQRFPYWDKELLMFFKTVPFKYKKMKLLYDEILTQHYFKPYNLNFEKEIQASLYSVFVQKIKNRLRPLLPAFIINKFLLKNDWKNYREITNQMLILLKKNKTSGFKIKKYNEIIIRWYLMYIKDLIK